MDKGKLIIISGPSGSGKGYLLKKLFAKEELNLNFSVSATTRDPREGEIDGKDYYFLTKDQFENWIKEDKLVEWATFVGNYYGTPWRGVNKIMDDGKNVVLDIEIIGVKNVKKIFPEAITIWVMPPSWEALQERLILRGTENQETINSRIEMGKKDSEEAKHVFDNFVINDDGEVAANEISELILR